MRYRHMTRKLLVVIVLILSSLWQTFAQDTLPAFSALTRGKDKVIISWTNTFPVTTQISIQRSKDSTKNFKTILTVPDPKVLQNGFVDAKADTPFMFYRLFIVQDSGKYVFTKSKRPIPDTAKQVVSEPLAENHETKQRVVVAENVTAQQAAQIKESIREATKEPAKEVAKEIPLPIPEKFITVKRRDSIISQVSEKQFKRFRDSVVHKTKDTIAFASVDTILIKPYIPPVVYKPSRFVYTEKDGNVAIILPEAGVKKYAVKFFDAEENPLFEIKEVKESAVTLDKTNFLRAGWFKFELYEDGKLKEKHKFFIPKDF
jgi:hypothetical protein